jgi:hypothetical protein
MLSRLQAHSSKIESQPVVQLCTLIPTGFWHLSNLVVMSFPNEYVVVHTDEKYVAHRFEQKAHNAKIRKRLQI